MKESLGFHEGSALLKKEKVRQSGVSTCARVVHMAFNRMWSCSIPMVVVIFLGLFSSSEPWSVLYVDR